MGEYVDNFTAALQDPPAKLVDTFQEEEQFLRSHVKAGTSVLAVGMESIRSLPVLTGQVDRMSAVDDSQRGVAWAEQHLEDVEQVELQHAEFSSLSFQDAVFNLVYSSYNVIGTVPDRIRPALVDEMVRVLKPGGALVNMTWKRDDATTRFLEDYYPRIGIAVENINTSRAITEKGMFRRISEEELVELYAAAGVDNVLFENIGPVWHAAVGVKP